MQSANTDGIKHAGSWNRNEFALDPWQLIQSYDNGMPLDNKFVFETQVVKFYTIC